MRILLVEDEDAVARSIELMLSAEGWVVDRAEAGEDGLEIGQTTEAMALRGDAGEVDISVKQSDLRCFVEEGGKRKMTQNFALP